jgi:acyl carrier protein
VHEVELSVLADIADMLRTILDENDDVYGDGFEAVEIEMETRFHRDLELESIDLVTLAGLLRDRYGDQVNFAEFLADMDFDEIIELTVGRLVEHVVRSLTVAEAG